MTDGLPSVPPGPGLRPAHRRPGNAGTRADHTQPNAAARRWLTALALLAAAGATVSPPAHAAADVDAVTVWFENDRLAGTSDRWYTHGTRVAWSYRDPRPGGAYGLLADAAGLLLWRPWGGPAPRVAGTLGQNLYTPADLHNPAFQPLDRPYAGWLYTGALAQRESGLLTETSELKIGVIGPASGAELVQKTLHRLSSSHEALGWGNQVRPQAGLELGYLARWRLGLGDSGVTLAPHGGLVAGTTRVQANVGAMLVVGRSEALPGLGEGLGETLAPVRGQGLSAFVGVDAAHVARNRFIDGDTFSGRPAITVRAAVTQFTAGVSMQFARGPFGHPLRLTYAFISRSPEFDVPGAGPPSRHRIGQLSLTAGF